MKNKVHYVTDPDIVYGCDLTVVVVGLSSEQILDIISALSDLEISVSVQVYDKNDGHRLGTLRQISDIILMNVDFADDFARGIMLTSWKCYWIGNLIYKNFNPNWRDDFSSLLITLLEEVKHE